MRSRQLVTESGTLIAPQDFLFIPLVARDSDQLKPPLNFHMVSIICERPHFGCSTLANAAVE